MKHNYQLLQTLRRIIFSVLVLSGLSIPSFAQVGFNNPDPDSSALIDMKATDMGLLIPRMDSVAKRIMANKSRKPAHSLLIFDLNNNMFFAYDTISSGWTALNPFKATSSTSDIITATSGNVGIGTNNPTAKLDVNGNIKSSGNASVVGTVTAGSVSTTGSVNAGSVTTGTISATSISTSGTVTATSFSGNGTTPIGGIIMWSGSTIPSGWALCNGQTVNGVITPDLRQRFIVGAGDSPAVPGTGYTTGDTGGLDQVTLTAAQSGLPDHYHTVQTQGSHGVTNPTIYSGQGGNIANPATSGVVGGAKDATQAHENRPPYYALAYIIRVQ